jgi:hypothetical protein
MGRALALVTILAAVATAVLGMLASGEGAGPGQRINAAGLGEAHVDGKRVLVEVFVSVTHGADPAAQVRAALEERGARPLRKSEYVTTGMVWNQFSDADAGNDHVTQYYNGGSASTVADPTGGGGLSALLNTQQTWTGVSSSSFALNYGGTTSRCPSLVQECAGDQVFDGFNDVAWLDLGRCNIFRCTLGVTWFATEDPDEADMALNTRVTWNTNGSNYDVETVMLHENGHAAGLGHSENTSAIMYAYYGGVRRSLHQDDVNGIAALYPADESPTNTPAPTDTPAPSATPAPTDTPGPSATPTNTPTVTNTAAPTATNTPHCPPGWQRQGRC